MVNKDTPREGETLWNRCQRLRSIRVCFATLILLVMAVTVHFQYGEIVWSGRHAEGYHGGPFSYPGWNYSEPNAGRSLAEEPEICGRQVQEFSQDCLSLFHYLMSCFVYYKRPGYGQEPLPNFYIARGFESRNKWADYKRSTIAFLHIEKTGGTSVEEVLREFATTNKMEEMTCFACMTITKIMRFQETNSTQRLFLRSSRLYGMHQFTRNDRPFLYITWLRHPVARVVSNYYYLKDQPTLRLDQFLIVEYLHSSLNLTDFLQRTEDVPIPLIDNFYTRLFLYNGYPDVAMRHEDCCFALKPTENLVNITEEHYLVARRNLRQMGLIGLTEQFAVSQDMATDMLGMKRLQEVKLRVTAPYKKDLSDYENKELRRRNHWDILLYEDAVEIFHRQLEVYNEFRARWFW